MKKKQLQRDHLESKIKAFVQIKDVALPPTGWIKAVRLALGMSMQQLANRLAITKQSVLEMEIREKDASISLKSLQGAAQALDMDLIYGFVPKDGSLDALIERKARELATEIVLRTSTNMNLEDQGNSPVRLKKSIEERTLKLKQEMPRVLWD